MTKELRRRLKKLTIENGKKMQEWWDRVLPRKGSLLRQLVDIELSRRVR